MAEDTMFNLFARIPDKLDRIADCLEMLGGKSTTTVSSRPSSAMDGVEAARSGPNEEVLIRYTDGYGEFDAAGKFIVLRANMFKMNGEPDGEHVGVFESLDPDPSALLRWFKTADGPFDAPGPVPQDADHIQIRAYTKAKWRFGDGSEIIATGPALVHLASFRDRSAMFFVSVAASITDGTGRYQNAIGIKTALGSTYLKPDALFGPGARFPGKTIETFRIINRRDVVLPPERQPSAEFPFESKYLQVRGSRMHYIDVGSGDPVLFLHGNPAWSYMWRNVIPHVRPHARCIAVDYIGMGKSDKPPIQYHFQEHAQYLQDFIAALNLDRITLVMNDWGTIFGFDYAMRYPHKIKGLAFSEAAFYPYRTWDDFLSPKSPPVFRQTFQRFRSGIEGVGPGWQALVEENFQVEQMFPQLAGRKLTKEEVGNYVMPFRDKSSRKVVWRFAQELPVEGQPPDVAERVEQYSRSLQESEIPKLLICGWPGVITSDYNIEWAKSHLKNLKIAHVGFTLHLPQESNPDLFGKELVEWYRNLK
jgi:haloalkane dehalogenase